MSVERSGPIVMTCCVVISPVYTGILIQILIQISCVYMEANPDSGHLSHVDCDPDLNLDSGPGACVNVPI